MSDTPQERAASVRKRGEDASTFSTDSASHGHFVAGFLEARLAAAFQREDRLESQLADMTEDRDGWKDLADARKPKTCLQLKP